MKNLLRLISMSFLFASTIAAQCEKEPTIEQTGKILHTKKFSVPFKTNLASKVLIGITGALTEGREKEMFLSFEASAPGANWMAKNAEAAVLTVFVDGKYNQDVILFAGAEKFNYRTSLGEFETGEHALTIVLNDARSAANAGQVKLSSPAIFPSALTLVKNNGDERDFIALTRAPVIYARPDTIDKFSDIPLVIYYEIFPLAANHFKIRYTTIFTNEDGGTRTAALMARWGRATDIEWVYEIEIKDGAVASEIYQGANHETKNFSGRKFGNHPLIFNQTVNNNFSDAGCSALRLAPFPIRADLSKKSRETIMDENGWTYRIMAAELIRENRVNAARLDENTIADPRDYLYAEIFVEELRGAAIAVEAETPDGMRISSDDGVESLRVNRRGYVRIALRLPPEFSKKSPLALAVRCHKISTAAADQESVCQNVNPVKAVRLDINYLPRAVKIKSKPRSVKAGEIVRFTAAFEKLSEK